MRSTTETRSTADSDARNRKLSNISPADAPSGCDNRRWPTCRIGTSGAAGIEDFSRAMIAFYRQPVVHADVAMELADKALWRKIMAALASNLRNAAAQGDIEVGKAGESIDKPEEVDDGH